MLRTGATGQVPDLAMPWQEVVCEVVPPVMRETHRDHPFTGDETRARVPRDRRVPGRMGTLQERGVDFERLRGERLEKVQVEMASRDIGALLLTDTINIRYTTGISVMPLWTATNLAHYVLVPATGSPVVFEMACARFRAEEFFSDVRNAYHWQARFAEQMAPERSAEWASEIQSLLREWDVADEKVGVDCLDYYGFTALQSQGLRLADADELIEAARKIKTPDEIQLLRQSAAICEAALYDVQQAIRPGVSEHELLGVFQQRLISLGGEHCFTRMLATGHRTNPWFQEASSKLVRPGDLVAFDTDATGPEGYICDVSRTFLCGDRPTPDQREAYRVAHDFVQEVAARLRPGLAYEDLVEDLPDYPPAYGEQRYPYVLHGIGSDDEPPFLAFPDEPGVEKPEGEFRENMVVSVEFYAGAVGGQDGVKLEDEVWVGPDGPVMLSLYPYEEVFLS